MRSIATKKHPLILALKKPGYYRKGEKRRVRRKSGEKPKFLCKI
jgi:hypothetical protein